MRTRYLLVPLALFVFGCNQSSETTQSERPVSKKQKKMVAAPEFVEQQFNSLDYQVKAFSIGLERLENEKIKDYLRDKLPMLENLRSDFQTVSINNGMKINEDTQVHKNELYKLTVADAKDFDKVFVLYYKEFLNNSIDKLSQIEVLDQEFIPLKDKYGHILYEQKLFFDVL